MNALTKLMWVGGVWGMLTSASLPGVGQEPTGADGEPAAVAAPARQAEQELARQAEQELAPQAVTKSVAGSAEESEPGSVAEAGTAKGLESGGSASGPSPAPRRAATRSTTARLPAYFATLVDSRQRAVIYEIREAMAEKINALERQLEELRRAEMREIEAVLSDDQRQRLELLRAARSSQPAAHGT